MDSTGKKGDLLFSKEEEARYQDILMAASEFLEAANEIRAAVSSASDFLSAAKEIRAAANEIPSTIKSRVQVDVMVVNEEGQEVGVGEGYEVHP